MCAFRSGIREHGFRRSAQICQSETARSGATKFETSVDTLLSLILVSASMSTDTSYLDLKSLKGLNSLYQKFNVLLMIYLTRARENQSQSDESEMQLGE